MNLQEMELTPQEFREHLAGIADPSNDLKEFEEENVKQEAIRFCTILAKFYNRESLDPMKLWTRIATALQVMYQKYNGDIEVVINEALNHIKADSSYVINEDGFQSFMDMIITRDKKWHDTFILYLEHKSFIVLSQAKRRWEEVKKGMIEL